MSLSAANTEKVIRMLLALEQRVDWISIVIPIMEKEEFPVGEDAVSLTQGQKSGITVKVSERVVTMENIMAAMEQEIQDSTSVVTGPPGAGIADWEAASTVLEVLTGTEAMADLRQRLASTILQNFTSPRGEDGELTSAAAPSEFIVQAKELFKKRLGRIKMVLIQLRALGA